MEHTYWEQADRFLNVVSYINGIRERLSPETKIDADELGSISAEDAEQVKPGHVFEKPIPNSYWNLCGAMYAYLYTELAKRGVEVAGESQLVGYPTQFPSVSMVDWETGQLFWNCRRAADGDERVALAKVREKYMDQFLKTDLHFFLGTTKEFHSWATNPFLIIGVFPIPHEKQLGLL